jgi:hypothetical protein
VSSKLYDKGRQAILEGSVAFLADTIKEALVGAGYTPDLAAHQFLSDLGANRLGTDQTLGSKTSTGGVAGAASPSWPAIATGSTVTYIAGYKDTGSSSTSPLIYLIDGKVTVTTAALANSGATSLTVDPLGADIASGTTFTIGGVSVTTTALASAGARTISVSATTGSIAAGSTGDATTSGANMPAPTNGSTFTHTIASTGNKLFKL